MYNYVENKDLLKKFQNFCSGLMSDLEDVLREEGINTQFFLVGSGARNMVTQNENEPIDFDYNFNILSCDDINDGKILKETARKAFNSVLRKYKLSDCDDSTSSLTTKPIYFTNNPELMFSIDICIVTKDSDGLWYRLKHEKTGYTYYDKYHWVPAPSSNDYQSKTRKIKEIPGWWEAVRDHYLDLKNDYLTRNDHEHPSFVCYIQSVNDVYNEMRQKRII